MEGNEMKDNHGVLLPDVLLGGSSADGNATWYFFVAATEFKRAAFGRLWRIGCRDTDLHSGGSYGAVLARHQKKKDSEAVGKLGFQDLCRLRATEGEG